MQSEQCVWRVMCQTDSSSDTEDRDEPQQPVETPANAGIQVLLFESTGRDAARLPLMPACARLVAEFRQVNRGSGGQAWWSVDSGGTVRAGGLRGSGYRSRHRAPPSSTDGGSTFKATSVE